MLSDNTHTGFLALVQDLKGSTKITNKIYNE